MRFLAACFLLFLVPSLQQKKPTLPANTSLEKRTTHSEADKPENDESCASHPATIAFRALAIEEPAGQTKERYRYDPIKDTLYRLYLWGTIFGVAGAVAGVLVLIRQTKALRDSQRAWVTANGVGNPPEPLYSPQDPGRTPGIVYLIEIAGNTPAKIIRERFRCRIVPAIQGEPQLETVPTYKSERGMFTGSAVYAPGYKYRISVPLESGPLTLDQASDLRDGKTLLCAYGCVDYLDAFKRKRKTQVCAIYNFAFGFVVTSPDGSTVLNPPGFRAGGPKGYNEVT